MCDPCAVSDRNELLLMNDTFRAVRARRAFETGGPRSSSGLLRRRVARTSSAGSGSARLSPRASVLSASSLASAGWSEGGGGDVPRRAPPRPAGGLVGRDKFIKRLGKLLLEREDKVLKVVGPEGSGKSAVGVEFAVEFRAQFPGGVVWLNGSSVVADVSELLVDELGLQSYANTLDPEHLRQRLWKFLFDTAQRWLLVLDDAEDAADWVPPEPMVRSGAVLLLGRARGGPGLALDLPMLSNRSLSEVLTRACGGKAPSSSSATAAALASWTDSFHLCRNLTGLRLLGFLASTYGLGLDTLLVRYDAAVRRAVLPDLDDVLRRAGLSHHAEALRNEGVLNCVDFVRGAPWRALEGTSRRDQYLFEKVQENLHRSGNRLGTKVLCKLWCDLVKDAGEEPNEREAGRHVWELLSTCAFFRARHIPVGLVAPELTLVEGPASSSSSAAAAPGQGDMVYASGAGLLSVTPSLLVAVRSIVVKPTEATREKALRVLERLHAHCAEYLLAGSHKLVGIAEGDDSEFRALTDPLLLHIAPAIDLALELLRPPELLALGSGSGSGGAGGKDDAPLPSLAGTSSNSRRRSSKGGKRVRPRHSSTDASDEGDEEAPEELEQERELEEEQLASGSKASGKRLGDLDPRSPAEEKQQPSPTARRHSLFSFSSGMSLSLSAPPPESATPPPTPPSTPGRRRTSLGMSGAPGELLKSLTRRFSFTQLKGGGGSSAGSAAALLVADLLMVEGMLLLIMQLGRARLERAEQRLRRALAVYEQCEERAGARAAQCLVAQALFKRGLVADALELWEDLLEALPGAETSQRQLVLASVALARASLRQPERALAAADQAVKLADHDLLGARSWAARATALREAGRGAEAVDALRRALAPYDDLCPLSLMSAELHKALAAALLRLHRHTEARTHAEEAISVYSAASAAVHRRNMQLSEAHCILGSILMADGDWRGAIEAFQRCIEHWDRLAGDVVDNPDALAVYLHMADCQRRLGHADEAAACALLAESMDQRLSKWLDVFADAAARSP